MKTNIGKNISLTFELENGIKRDVDFYPILVYRNGIPVMGKSVCTTCTYGVDVCRFLNIPKLSSGPSGDTFMEVCQSIDSDDLYISSSDGERRGIAFIPVPGTLERFPELMDNGFRNTLKSKRVIELSHVIDALCPDTCSYYRPDHSECKNCVGSCILHDILKVERENNDKQFHKT